MKTFRNTLRWLGTSVLGLLGFAACGGLDPDADPVLNGRNSSNVRGGSVINEFLCAYGSPTAAYKVSGTVRNSSGQKLGGIQVVSIYGEQTWMRTDTTYTDASGSFSGTMRTYPSDKVQLVFNDVDGSKNGEYQSQTVSVTPKKVGDGDGSWFKGTYEVSASVMLKKK